MTDVEPARSRREEYAEATYEALLDSAAACFYENGFAATSLDQVAQRARVTKGAIYHHFASKRDLFMAVLDHQEELTGRTITQAGANALSAWDGIVAAFDAFLESLSDPVYQRLCFVEGPTALGFEEWWACGERYEIGIIRNQLERAAAAGILAVEDLDMLAGVLFGAVTAGVLAMVRSGNPVVERDRFRSVMLSLMAGLVRSASPPNLGKD
ncbi:MAG TPA: TetR/AcrR family transcriptional regulator [Acidimicrobiales bacterium]|jgi:AcrR family transcriptional regulator|nr:TetR/AcrR family transcriptional regulator [Acidimicrobiales bacterium]